MISPLRAALGAGLGRADALPMVSTVTVPRALKPVPVITMISSTTASAGTTVIEGLGMANAVVLPVIVPILTVTILVPGASEPPVEAAGTSVTTLKAPSPSVMKPPTGIPLAVPKLRVVPVVLGGNALPLTVTRVPVEAEAGSTVTVPEGTFKAIATGAVPAASTTDTQDVFADLISNNDNLVRVWRFSNATQTWDFFDPRPAFEQANTLLKTGAPDIVWVNVNTQQEFQGQTLFPGWNLISLK